LQIFTLPTILTLARVAAIPALIVSWFSQEWTACAALFIGASLTDYLDGYLARKLNASSAFGAFLDPVADKLMVTTVLILNGLTAVPAGPLVGNTWLFPVLACVIIGREITMSALREWAAALGPEAHSAVAVSWTGKWKTAAQMVSLTLLLVAKVPGLEVGAIEAVGAAGVVLLGVAALLTVWSLVEYFRALWKFMLR
jgi:CDP-diacylglycerol---glycerol-3-phosphate 3-phosphatidyltransferase